MKWKREVESKHLQSFDLFGLSIIGLFLVGIILKNFIPFIIAALLLVHIVFHKLFEKSVSENIIVENPKRSVRLFPGEDMVWKIQMENKSFFPIINGKLRFNLGHNVQVMNNDTNRKNYWYGIEIPYSISSKRKPAIEVPIKAVERGTARMTQLVYEFPHLFSFHQMKMRYDEYYQTEFIVYPELKEVTGLEVIYHQFPGDARMQYSPYEDIQSSIGTRDYQSSDSFQRINWKASVRSQELQTNIYEKVADLSFVYIVNLKQEQRVGESTRTEDLLSYTAFLSKFATEQDTSYEILLNVRQHGSNSFLQLPEGNDNRHLARSLEFLARIPRQPIASSFELLLFHVSKTLQQRKTIIIIGEISEESYAQITQLEQKGHTVFQINESNGVASITSVSNRKIA
ncbi:DUF58 domain-containing protein [Oceanobacillus sp. CAU 1775]